MVWWCGGVVVWWCGGLVVWWCGGVVVWWCSSVVWGRSNVVVECSVLSFNVVWCSGVV